MIKSPISSDEARIADVVSNRLKSFKALKALSSQSVSGHKKFGHKLRNLELMCLMNCD